MMLLAIVFPFLSFIFRGQIFKGIICFFLQIILIGWLPAAVWAVMSLKNDRDQKRYQEIIKELKNRES